MIKDLQKRIELFNKAKESIKSDLKKFVVDKSYPLNERWNLFIESDLGDIGSYVPDFIFFDIYQCGRDFNRYELVSVERISLYGRDFNRYELVSVERISENLDTDEEENSFKEEILQMFIKSFIFDW